MGKSREPPKKRGPKPNRFKIKGDWQSTVGEALKKERTKIDQMHRGVRAKNKFFENFYLLITQTLTNFDHPKNTRIFNQIRKFALIRGACFFKPPSKK